MNRYSADASLQDGMTVIVLTDIASRTEAKLLPEAGNNLFGFGSAGREAIRTPVGLRTLRDSAGTKYGTPLLFPPNRIRDGHFRFRDRSYDFPINEPPDHHLHGELSNRAWNVMQYGASEEDGAWVTSRLLYGDHPDILAYFPHPLTFTVTYRLLDGKLHMESTIKNEGADEAPFAYGLHPYFSIPYESDLNVELRLPAKEEWPITNLSFATGTPAPTAFSRAVDGGALLGSYPKLGCSMLSLDPEAEPVCRIAMNDTGYTIAYRVDEQFPFVLLFRPDWDDTFSIEPYTCVTDAFNLPYAHALTGAGGILPGEERVLRTSLWIEPHHT